MLERKKSSLCGPKMIRNPERQRAVEMRLKEETKLNSVMRRLLEKVGATCEYSKLRVNRY